MEKQLQRYESYNRGVKRLLMLSGLWPGRVSSNLFKLVVVTHFTLGIVAACGIMYFVVSHIANLDFVTKGLGIVVSFYTILMKVIVFTIYRKNFVELHETLEKSFREDLQNAEYQPVLLSPLAFFDFATVYMGLATLGVMTMYDVGPIIGIIIQLSHGNAIIKLRTPFPSKYPLPESNGFYVTRYIIEVGASCALGTITAATDALFGFYVFQISSQLRVLSYRMKKLTVADDYRRIIRECIMRRQLLARCRDKLETIYGPIILWMLTASAMTICANIFQASQISMDQAALLFIFITGKMAQCLLYGCFGLFLTTESEAFRDAIYSCGWPGCGDKLLVSNIKTMLMCRPLVLRAWKFYAISLDMFITVMNTTLSYFFLLRTLDEK